MGEGTRVIDCPPCTTPLLAVLLAALSGVAVLVGGLCAYLFVITIPKLLKRWSKP